MLLGGFQGAGDPTCAGWINAQNNQPITTDTNSSFVAIGVPNYPLSLQLTGAGGFGNPSSLELQLSAAQRQALLTNSWLTFTFSVPPTASTGGYSQLYNLQFQFFGAGFSSSYGSTNWGNGGNAAATWGTYSKAEGTTNNNSSGQPNYYLYSGYPLQSQTVTINYSPLTNAINTGVQSAGYVNILFQGNTGGGAPLIQDFNNVVLSTGPFGTSAGPPAGTFVVDDFSSAGVSPSNPANYDYFPSNEVYSVGQISNVWVNYFGSAFVSNSWAQGVSPGYASANGSMAVQLNWASGNQFTMWENGSIYGPNLSALNYTNFQCDVMFAQGSATDLDGTFGNLQFGTPAANNAGNNGGQDYFGGAGYGIEIPSTNAGIWQHVSIALNANTDPNLLNISSVVFHIYQGYTGGQLSGPSTLYIANVKFVGPVAVPPPLPPVLSIHPVVPGLRMFVGNSATYLREGVITTQGSGENNSWVGSGVHYPVNYSFQLLSYPSNNIDITELAVLPEDSFNPTSNFQTTIYNNSFLDFQDSNGLYVVLSPHGGGGAVVGAVQWKVGLPSPANALTNLVAITNSTAIGTWALTMNDPTHGTLSAPGGSTASFIIPDPNVSSDFANPAVVAVFEQPGTTAGYGLYEDYGTISVTGTASGAQTENFSTDTNQFNSTGTSQGGFYQNTYSVDTNNLVVVRNGLDAYWFSWTGAPLNNYQLVTATNVLIPAGQWFSPLFYSDYNIPEETAPEGVGVQHTAAVWELLSKDNLPTANGQQQPMAPTITYPPAPNAYFMLTTNNISIYP